MFFFNFKTYHPYWETLYKNAVSNMEQNCIQLTINFATDGAPLNDSTKRSFWPQLVIINELPPKLRFKYPLLTGLWIGKKVSSADVMNTFMKSFVNQMGDLGKTGFTLNVDGKNVRCTLDPASIIDVGVEVLSFDRCICSGMVIHSEYYTKARKSKNSVFRLENECFVNLLKRLKYGDIAYAKVGFTNVKNIVLYNAARESNYDYLEINDVVLRRLFEVVKSENNDIIKVTKLKTKCVFINTDGDRTYISTLPNIYETQ